MFFPHHPLLLTSELQTPQLEGDQAIADLDDVHQGVEVVRCEDEAVARAVVAPATEQQISAQTVLQRARQVLVENRIQIVVVRTFRKRKDHHHSYRTRVNMGQIEMIRL